jgi:hypothetical protein
MEGADDGGWRWEEVGMNGLKMELIGLLVEVQEVLARVCAILLRHLLERYISRVWVLGVRAYL